jgi:hypothetical protein
MSVGAAVHVLNWLPGWMCGWQAHVRLFLVNGWRALREIFDMGSTLIDWLVD